MCGDIEVCLFSVRGEFGHWRKWFTTTSALTFSFPPRTALIGMIGAVLGIEREDVPKVFPFHATHIAVCPVAPIVKDRFPQKWRKSPLSIKSGKVSPEKADKTFQQNLEVVRRPCYMIAFSHKDNELMRELCRRLEERRWFYPPFLGIMGFLADLQWHGFDVAMERRVHDAEIRSVLPLDETLSKEVDLSESWGIIREERIPLDVLRGRSFRHLYLAYVSRDAKPMKLKSQKGVRLFRLRHQGDFIAFFEQCQPCGSTATQ